MDGTMDVTTDVGRPAPEHGPPALAAPETAGLETERPPEAVAAEVADRLKAERVQEALAAAEVAARLKAERVQEAFAAIEFAVELAGRREGEPGLLETVGGRGERLDGERLQCMLTETPGWRPSADSRTIRRRFRFPALRPATAFTTQVGELAAIFHHQPEVRIYGNDVLVTFSTRSKNGVTHVDIAMARAVNLLPGLPL